MNVINKLVLACEIELGNYKLKSLYHDFSKLIVSNSEYRVFIYWLGNKQNEWREREKHIYKFLKTSSEKFKPAEPEAKYMIIGLPKRKPGNELPRRLW